MLELRSAEAADHEGIIQLWHQGWHDAHAHLVPTDVLALRTMEHFTIWLKDAQDAFFVATDDANVVGFVSIKKAEVVKLYVGRRARGTGAAQTLLAFAEEKLRDSGIYKASLFCTAGNIRAERFYQRKGWSLSRSFEDALWTPEGVEKVFTVLTHHFEKDLKLAP